MNRTALFAIVAAAGLAAALPATAAAPGAVQSGSYAVEPYHTRVQFAIDHLGVSEFYGDFTGVSGTLDLDAKAPAHSRVAITIPTASVSTTNTKLDEELRSAQWLDAGGNPEIRFVSTRVAPLGQGRARIFGTLTLHGVTRPVVLDARFHGAGVNPMSKRYNVGFDATTQFRRSDFGVKNYLPMLGDTIAVRISAAFERKAS